MTDRVSTSQTSEDQIFSTLLNESSPGTKLRLGDRLMAMQSVQRSGWLSKFVHWLSSRDPSHDGAALAALEEVPQAAGGRLSAVRLTFNASQHHSGFKQFVKEADLQRDTHNWHQAEFSYWSALQLFPLHGGYRVQYAHMLKDQGKHLDAYVHYCFALASGAPVQDVEEHLLFTAGRSGLRATSGDVTALARAWIKLEQTQDDWDAPPVEQDFRDFGRLFWSNHGLLLPTTYSKYLLQCPSRRSLFISLLGCQETVRANRLLFAMIYERAIGRV